MFCSDDEDEGGLEWSFAAVEKEEALISFKALITTDEKLYNVRSSNENLNDHTFPETNDLMRRFDSDGYEANFLGVSDNEIQQWQRAFPFLRISGTKIQYPDTPFLQEDVDKLEALMVENKNDNISTTIFDHISSRLPPDHCDLNVIGKKIKLQNLSESDKDYFNEELLSSQGIIEELLVIHQDRNDTLSEGNDNKNFDPCESIKEEVLSMLTETVWPEIVDSLDPFISAINEKS